MIISASRLLPSKKSTLIFISFLIAGLWFGHLSIKAYAQTKKEQRAVWIQSDVNLNLYLDRLKQAHFNTLYFGIWGANNMSLQEIIDLAHSKGFDIHLWEANAYICAGQWLEGCTNNINKPEWRARLPNGMSRRQLLNKSDYFDFGVPSAKEYSINVMTNYLKNYDAEGIHFDYIRYDSNKRGNYTFNKATLNDFQKQFGVPPQIIRGDKFPAFAVMYGNRVSQPTTAQVLAKFHDGVPAILVNNYQNGQVLVINWKAFYPYLKVTSQVLTKTLQQYGGPIYIASTSVNTGEYGPFYATTNWIKFLGFNPTEVSLTNISQLPTGSLLILPGIYSYSSSQINKLKTHLSQGGNLIFIDGPTATIAKGNQIFKDILGVNSSSSYLKTSALIELTDAGKNHTLTKNSSGTHTLTYKQASDYINKWYQYMENTITDIVNEVYLRASQIKPEAQISAAVFPAEEGNNLTVHQNWPLWIEGGFLDYNMTMGYTLDMNKFSNRLDWLRAHNLTARSIPGLGVHKKIFSDCSDKNNIIQQIQLLRNRGFRGFSIFQAKYLTSPTLIPYECGILNDLENLLVEDVEPYYPPKPSITTTPTPPPQLPIKILKAKIPILIDGQDYEYQKLEPIKFADTSNRGNRDNQTTVRTLWDNKKLYLLIQVIDTQLNTSKTPDIWLDDTVEVLIDPLNNDGTSFSNDDYRMMIRIDNKHYDSRGIWDDTPDWNSWTGNANYTVKTTGTINNNTDTDTGYSVELAVPWSDLQITPSDRYQIGLDIATEDNDPNDGYQYSDWAKLSDFSHPNAWKTVSLSQQTGSITTSEIMKQMLAKWTEDKQTLDYNQDGKVNSLDQTTILPHKN